jgi:hypothetical protein
MSRGSQGEGLLAYLEPPIFRIDADVLSFLPQRRITLLVAIDGQSDAFRFRMLALAER